MAVKRRWHCAKSPLARLGCPDNADTHNDRAIPFPPKLRVRASNDVTEWRERDAVCILPSPSGFVNRWTSLLLDKVAVIAKGKHLYSPLIASKHTRWFLDFMVPARGVDVPTMLPLRERRLAYNSPSNSTAWNG